MHKLLEFAFDQLKNGRKRRLFREELASASREIESLMKQLEIVVLDHNNFLWILDRGGFLRAWKNHRTDRKGGSVPPKTKDVCAS